tara:strand:+ start:509 stop:1372 length:864 start_codon:yes stop_codon:yes gene_type:complete
MNLRYLIGRTPLVQISPRIYAKLETYNPSGSVKDRMAHYLIDKAIDAGELTKGHSTIVEASSGNTGISLSMVGASLGYKVIIVMPRNMSVERKNMMKAYGAEIIEVGDNAFADAISLRDELVRKNVSYWSPMQFSNLRNVECHFATTAVEINNHAPSDASMCAFIHGGGTGGTIMGVKKYFDQSGIKHSPKFFLVTPKESSLTHGIQGINDGQDFLVDRASMDGIIKISTNDAIARARRLATEMGLLVGISSGANVLACEKYVEDNDIDGYVVTMLCDRGERYLSVY